MKIATAGSAKSKRWRTQDTTWDGVLHRLRETTRTGETCAEYRRMTKEEQGTKKEAAGGFVGGALNGGRRVAGAVSERWLITLDADEARVGDWDNAVALNEWAMAAYSTHSHTPEKPRLRWVLPLSRAVSREEYEPLCRAVARELGVIETLDPSTYQPERLMYWPTSPQDGEYLFMEQDGPWVNPDEMLATYGPDEAWRSVSAWPLASREREIVRRELRVAENPTEKTGIVGAFCRTYDVHSAIAEFLSDVYTESGEGRYTYAAGSTAGGAVVYGDGAWLYSNHATDPAWGQLCNAFDLVRIHKFGELDAESTAQGTGLPSYQRMSKWCAELDAVKQSVVEDRLERVRDDFADMAGTCAAGEESGRDDEWKKRVTVNHKTGEADPTIENAMLIIQNEPNLRGAIAHNEFSARPVLRRDVPWRPRGSVKDKLNGEPWTDTDDAGLRLYMESVWGLKGRQVIQDAWALECARNAFHPVREYLTGLEWDGKERLDTMLIRWLKAEDSEYTRAASRKWMCAAVARVMEPGRKFDNMLVLVGRQGIGKSTLARTLSRGWFTDSIQRLDGKDAYESLRGVWIVELAELAATKRSETETIKNFISKAEDTYRPAYGRHTVVYPRQCLFYGTTNDPDFLKDKSGNRRFWPVDATGVNNGELRGLEEEVDQLWAEAVVRWRGGEVLWMNDETLRKAAQEAQEQFTVQDDLAGQVMEFLDKKLPRGWDDLPIEERVAYMQGRSTLELGVCDSVRKEVCGLEIRREMLGESQESIGRNDMMSRRIGDILNHLAGWERVGKVIRRGAYGPQRVYRRVAKVEFDELD
ncbi:MAG: hypothetical protein IKY91_04870 [Akkermansia sp.]|nr:hypothetical protein [Akkermansia sp.]